MKMETGNLEGTRLVQHVRQPMCCGTCTASVVVVLLSSTGNTELPNKFDVVRVDLQPSEQYKSVRPCSRPHAYKYKYICTLVH